MLEAISILLLILFLVNFMELNMLYGNYLKYAHLLVSNSKELNIVLYGEILIFLKMQFMVINLIHYLKAF